MKKINKESSAGPKISPNGGSNVEIGAAASKKAAEDSQTPGTRKHFAYSKHKW